METCHLATQYHAPADFYDRTLPLNTGLRAASSSADRAGFRSAEERHNSLILPAAPRRAILQMPPTESILGLLLATVLAPIG